MIYILAIICILSILLNAVLFRVILSNYIGMIHTKDGVVWIELQSKNSLDKRFGIVTIEKN